jgi:c-di-GMP-related signal transduction protein
MLRLPMGELVPMLPLRAEIREAMKGAEVAEGCLLAWLVSHDHGEWAACDEIARQRNLDREQLLRCYAKAVAWAQSALHFS